MEEAEKGVKPKEVIDKLKEFCAVERVYGEPLEIQGKTIVPVARFGAGGGGGGGGGEGPTPDEGGEAQAGEAPGKSIGNGSGKGMGFGFGAGIKPMGFLVVDGEETRWIPVLDVEKIVLKSIGVAVAAIKVAGKIANNRAKKKNMDKGK